MPDPAAPQNAPLPATRERKKSHVGPDPKRRLSTLPKALRERPWVERALVIDAQWLTDIARLRRPSLTFFFRALCRFLDPDVGVLVVIALALFGGLFNQVAHRLTMATLIAGVFVVIIKPSVRRTRPVFDINAAVPPDRFSFPSGHTAAAFAIALSLLGAAPAMVVPALLVAATVGFARVYLGVHYPIDVFFGALLGCFTGLIAGLL